MFGRYWWTCKALLVLRLWHCGARLERYCQLLSEGLWANSHAARSLNWLSALQFDVLFLIFCGEEMKGAWRWYIYLLDPAGICARHWNQPCFEWRIRQVRHILDVERKTLLMPKKKVATKVHRWRCPRNTRATRLATNRPLAVADSDGSECWLVESSNLWIMLECLSTCIRVTRESMRILSVTRYARQAMEYGSEDLHIDSSCGIACYNQIHGGGLNLVCICGDYWTRYTEEYSGVMMMKCTFVEVFVQCTIRYCGYN